MMDSHTSKHINRFSAWLSLVPKGAVNDNLAEKPRQDCCAIISIGLVSLNGRHEAHITSFSEYSKITSILQIFSEVTLEGTE
jgi:hypothetical protein